MTQMTMVPQKNCNNCNKIRTHNKHPSSIQWINFNMNHRQFFCNKTIGLYLLVVYNNVRDLICSSKWIHSSTLELCISNKETKTNTHSISYLQVMSSYKNSSCVITYAQFYSSVMKIDSINYFIMFIPLVLNLTSLPCLYNSIMLRFVLLGSFFSLKVTL